MKPISITPSQRKVKKFRHPFLDGSESHTKEQLEAIASEVLAGRKDKDSLLMALRSCLRNLVGRYLYYFPESRRFEDEMVSEGILAIVSILDTLNESMLEGKGIFHLAASRINGAIKKFLNKNRAFTAPSLRYQYKLPEPVYVKSISIHGVNLKDETNDNIHPKDDGDEWKRDFIEILDCMKESDHIDKAILLKTNWGATNKELAKELNVSPETVRTRRHKLYEKFLDLMRAT